MSLRNRILIHGLMAALPLALIGYLMAIFSGMWVSAQSSPRQGPAIDATLATASNGDDVSSILIWKLPLFLAVGGFLFVAVGEMLRWMWTCPKASGAA